MQNVVRVKLGLIVICLAALTAHAQRQPSNATKQPPQAQTQEEYRDYNAAYVIAGGPPIEKAADLFAAKYPHSELRSHLYSRAMREYQNANDPAKVLAMGERVLALDPDNSIALVLTSAVLADSLSDADSARTEKVAEINKNSSHALQTMDSAFVPPPGAAPEQIAEYKATLVGMAHAALGIMELKTGDAAAAEKDLKAAAEANEKHPDCYIWYHLALAEDQLKKYAEALVSVDQALKFAGSNPDLSKLAQGERTRLVQLAPPSIPNLDKRQ
jgi:tetratricopeptide (TPR) repeat protein